MNRKQSNHLAMFRALVDMLQKYATKLNKIEKLKISIENLLRIVKEISDVLLIQEGRITGFTQLKHKEQEEMINATIQAASVLYAYADMEDVAELKSIVNASVSVLKSMTDEALRVYCTNVHKETVKLGEVLVPYGYSAEKGSNLEKSINDFTEVISSPRSHTVTRKQATNQLKELIDEGNAVIRNNIDKLMVLAYQDDSNMEAAYKAARVIVDKRGHSSKDKDEANEAED